MTDKDKEQARLTRLAEALVEDILQAPEAEILEDFTAARGDPVAYAALMQARFQKALLVANKSRLRAAKTGLAAANSVTISTKIVDLARARQVLRRVLASPAATKLTLAARNETELSDADVLGMLEDLRDLGLWVTEDDEGDPASPCCGPPKSCFKNWA